MIQFDSDGILVIENFLDQEEVESLRNACYSLVENMDPDVHRGVFSAEAKDTQAHVKFKLMSINNDFLIIKISLAFIIYSECLYYFRQTIGTS